MNACATPIKAAPSAKIIKRVQKSSHNPRNEKKGGTGSVKDEVGGFLEIFIMWELAQMERATCIERHLESESGVVRRKERRNKENVVMRNKSGRMLRKKRWGEKNQKKKPLTVARTFFCPVATDME